MSDRAEQFLTWLHAHCSFNGVHWVDAIWQRWPRLCAVVSHHCALSRSETANAIRNYIDGQTCLVEAVWHYGGAERCIRDAVSYRNVVIPWYAAVPANKRGAA